MDRTWTLEIRHLESEVLEWRRHHLRRAEIEQAISGLGPRVVSDRDDSLGGIYGSHDVQLHPEPDAWDLGWGVYCDSRPMELPLWGTASTATVVSRQDPRVHACLVHLAPREDSPRLQPELSAARIELWWPELSVLDLASPDLDDAVELGLTALRMLGRACWACDRHAYRVALAAYRAARGGAL